MENAKHTPTPWRLKQIAVNDGRVAVEGPNGEKITDLFWGAEWDEEELANARRIVHCVNCHDELLAALEGLLGAAEFADGESSPPGFYGPAIQSARAVVAKAKGAA